MEYGEKYKIQICVPAIRDTPYSIRVVLGYPRTLSLPLPFMNTTTTYRREVMRDIFGIW